MHADFQLVFKMKNSIFNKFKLLNKKSKKIDLYKLTIDNYEVFFQFQYRSPKIDESTLRWNKIWSDETELMNF